MPSVIWASPSPNSPIWSHADLSPLLCMSHTHLLVLLRHALHLPQGLLFTYCSLCLRCSSHRDVHMTHSLRSSSFPWDLYTKSPSQWGLIRPTPHTYTFLLPFPTLIFSLALSLSNIFYRFTGWEQLFWPVHFPCPQRYNSAWHLVDA